MPEEQNRAGGNANERLIALLDGLGWSQQGDTDVDVPCELNSHQERDRPHGVDGYMTYDDPYRSRERGVIIESKTKSWSNTNQSELQSDAKQTLETLECVPQADEFDEYLNYGENRNVDASVLGVWVHDGQYDDNDFSDYVNSINIRLKQRKPFQTLVLGNRDMNRLASLHSEFTRLRQTEFDSENESLDFYYPSLPDTLSKREQLVSLEYMLSDYVFAKGRKVVGNSPAERHFKDIHIVFYFDDVNMDSLDFMFQALLEYQMTDADEIWVYLDDRNPEEDFQLESITVGFEQHVLPDGSDAPEFEFQTLPQVQYDSYTDRLRGE